MFVTFVSNQGFWGFGGLGFLVLCLFVGFGVNHVSALLLGRQARGIAI